MGSLSRFFFSSRRRHTSCGRDWSSDVCSSDLAAAGSWKYEGPKPLPPRLLGAGLLCLELPKLVEQMRMAFCRPPKLVPSASPKAWPPPYVSFPALSEGETCSGRPLPEAKSGAIVQPPATRTRIPCWFLKKGDWY